MILDYPPALRDLRFAIALIDRIERWLAQQNWATARRAAEDGEWTAPTERFEIGGSVVVLEAHPKPDGLRGNRETPTIWAGPMEGGVFDEPVPIYKDLKAKAKAYGRPGAPYVLPHSASGISSRATTSRRLLYGKEVVQIPIGPNGGAVGPAYLTRDFQGLWQRGQTPTYRRVTGVLSGIHIAPWTVAQNPLTLWQNPWAEHSLSNSSDLPWKTVTGEVEENVLVTRDATRPPHDIFGLPDDWPGPGDRSTTNGQVARNPYVRTIDRALRHGGRRVFRFARSGTRAAKAPSPGK